MKTAVHLAVNRNVVGGWVDGMFDTSVRGIVIIHRTLSELGNRSQENSQARSDMHLMWQSWKVSHLGFLELSKISLLHQQCHRSIL